MSFSAKTQFSASSCKKKKKLEIVTCACLEFLRCLLKLIQYFIKKPSQLQEGRVQQLALPCPS